MDLFPDIDDFTSLFRLLDDYEAHCSNRECSGRRRSGRGRSGRGAAPVRGFSPRFDMRETEDTYHIEGEFPGVSRSDIEIELSDPQTIVIKGHAKREYPSRRDS